MSWLSRLKSQIAPDTHPTEPTKPPFVGFVGTPDSGLQKTQVRTACANDASTCNDLDPDRWCWLNSSAMNGREIDTFTARMARFTDRGLDLDTSERLADRLVHRDRGLDDRVVCLECIHLQRLGGWRCGEWQLSCVAIRARDAQLPAEFVNLLQRCDGFKPAIHSQHQGGHDGQTQAG